MTVLPQPDDLTSLVLRTSFGGDLAWREFEAALRDESATLVSDPAYADATVESLVAADAGAEDDDKLTYLFLADATTLADAGHPLLAVDLYTEAGRTFRLPLRWFEDVSANLAIANMDFDEFADHVDESGAYLGE
ncbi:DUF6924 domain-containing protein [Winogradskya humida]|uniref:DUF6924 domain-containing protein n=1 Tax=Winogradskya humida TaxID=113566 RepID=A0ABQ3ZSQ5_9ACTN|nr:hypothetical protein [Actinoplanes humidus]GIE21611.1 hypothetical protein Ahu01nite_047130 [Actinoplanes humidus]